MRSVWLLRDRHAVRRAARGADHATHAGVRAVSVRVLRPPHDDHYRRARDNHHAVLRIRTLSIPQQRNGHRLGAIERRQLPPELPLRTASETPARRLRGDHRRLLRDATDQYDRRPNQYDRRPDQYDDRL